METSPSSADSSPSSPSSLGGDLPDHLFDALDEIASVVVALRDDPEHGEKAQRLDRAGKRIIDTLVQEFSLKSAQMELLMRELDDVRSAWDTYIEKVTRRNQLRGDRRDDGGAVA